MSVGVAQEPAALGLQPRPGREHDLGTLKTFPWENPVGVQLAGPEHQRAVEYLARRTASRKKGMRDQHLVAAKSMTAALQREQKLQQPPKTSGTGILPSLSLQLSIIMITGNLFCGRQQYLALHLVLTADTSRPVLSRHTGGLQAGFQQAAKASLVEPSAQQLSQGSGKPTAQQLSQSSGSRNTLWQTEAT